MEENTALRCGEGEMVRDTLFQVLLVLHNAIGSVCEGLFLGHRRID